MMIAMKMVMMIVVKIKDYHDDSDDDGHDITGSMRHTWTSPQRVLILRDTMNMVS